MTTTVPAPAPAGPVGSGGRKLDPRIPDFFIVGAPGCGTTFMHEHLRAHPEIFMPELKEPSYFCPDLDTGTEADAHVFIRDLQRYLALFEPARDGQQKGEASPFYLYSRVAAGSIREANPDARIIIMLRNPAEMIHYLHARRFLVGSEDLERFEDALAAEEDRKRGLRLPPYVQNVTGLYYREVGRYSEQVERYLGAFGRDQVKVIVFEEFRRDPETAYRETLRFLRVDPTFRRDLGRVNQGVVVRSVPLHRLVHLPVLRRTLRRVTPARVRIRLRAAIRELNAKPGRMPLDPGLRARLEEEYRPDVERLGKLLGRDLAAIWFPPGRPHAAAGQAGDGSGSPFSPRPTGPRSTETS